jgi:hypothetical protein
MKILCHECGASCSNDVPPTTVVRGYIMCGECVERVSEKTWATFVREAHAGPRFIETPETERTPNEISRELMNLPSDREIHTDAEVDQFLKDNEDLMNDLQEQETKETDSAQFDGDAPYPVAPMINFEPMPPDNSFFEDMKRINDKIALAVAGLLPEDRKEYRKFQRYLQIEKKYGRATLLKRKFWRKYLLGEE